MAVMLLTKAQQKKLQVTWNTITSVMNSFKYEIPEDYERSRYHRRLDSASEVQAAMPQEVQTLVKTVLYQNFYDCFKDVKRKMNHHLLFALEKTMRIIKCKEHFATTLYPPPQIMLHIPTNVPYALVKYKGETAASISYSEESGFKWHWEHVKRTTDTLIKLAYIINNYGTIHGVECIEKPTDSVFVGKWTGIPTQYADRLTPEGFLIKLCYLRHYCKENDMDMKFLDIRDIKG